MHRSTEINKTNVQRLFNLSAVFYLENIGDICISSNCPLQFHLRKMKTSSLLGIKSLQKTFCSLFVHPYIILVLKRVEKIPRKNIKRWWRERKG